MVDVGEGHARGHRWQSTVVPRRLRRVAGSPAARIHRGRRHGPPLRPRRIHRRGTAEAPPRAGRRVAHSTIVRRMQAVPAATLHDAHRSRPRPPGTVLPPVGMRTPAGCGSRRPRHGGFESARRSASYDRSRCGRFRTQGTDHPAGHDHARRRPAEERTQGIRGRLGHAQVDVGTVGTGPKAHRGVGTRQSEALGNGGTAASVERPFEVAGSAISALAALEIPPVSRSTHPAARRPRAPHP